MAIAKKGELQNRLHLAAAIAPRRQEKPARHQFSPLGEQIRQIHRFDDSFLSERQSAGGLQITPELATNNGLDQFIWQC